MGRLTSQRTLPDEEESERKVRIERVDRTKSASISEPSGSELGPAERKEDQVQSELQGRGGEENLELTEQ